MIRYFITLMQALWDEDWKFDIFSVQWFVWIERMQITHWPISVHCYLLTRGNFCLLPPYPTPYIQSTFKLKIFFCVSFILDRFIKKYSNFCCCANDATEVSSRVFLTCWIHFWYLVGHKSETATPQERKTAKIYENTTWISIHRFLYPQIRFLH